MSQDTQLADRDGLSAPLEARLRDLRAARGDLSAHEFKLYNELEALAR